MIQMGSQGHEVAAWQQYLIDMEYDVDIDGVFGTKTREATIEFQKWCQIAADGIVNKDTYNWAAQNGYTGGYTH